MCTEWRSTLHSFLRELHPFAEQPEKLAFLGRHQAVLQDLGWHGMNHQLVDFSTWEVGEYPWILGFRAAEVFLSKKVDPECPIEKIPAVNLGDARQLAGELGVPQEKVTEGIVALRSWYVSRSGAVREPAYREFFSSFIAFIHEIQKLWTNQPIDNSFQQFAALFRKQIKYVTGDFSTLGVLAAGAYLPGEEPYRPRGPFQLDLADLPLEMHNQWLAEKQPLLQALEGTKGLPPWLDDPLQQLAFWLTTYSKFDDPMGGMFKLRVGSRNDPLIQVIAALSVEPSHVLQCEQWGVLSSKRWGELLIDLLGVEANAHNLIGDLRFPYVEGKQFPPLLVAVIQAYLSNADEHLSSGGDALLWQLIRHNREVQVTENGKVKMHEPLARMLSGALALIVKQDGRIGDITLKLEETALLHFALGELATSKAADILRTTAKNAPAPFLRATAAAAQKGMPTRRNTLTPRRRMEHAVALLHVVNRSRRGIHASLSDWPRQAMRLGDRETGVTLEVISTYQD